MGQNIVAETAERIFADLADPLTINRAKDTSWQAPLWKALTEAGLPLAWVAEDQGGAGASLAEGFDVLTAAGRFALPVPLVETMLAGWLLDKGGIASPEGAMTVAPTRPKDRITANADGTLSGTCAPGPVCQRQRAHRCVRARCGWRYHRARENFRLPHRAGREPRGRSPRRRHAGQSKAAGERQGRQPASTRTPCC